jgi:MFS family permease
VLINSAYRRLWIGQTVSLVGDLMFDTTLILWVSTVLLKGDKSAPLASSALLVIVALVTVFLGPLAGVFVDRWDSRATMMRTDLIRAALVTVLVLIASLTEGSMSVRGKLVLIGVVVACGTAASQFFGPARAVLLRQVVPLEQQESAAGYAQSTAALAEILGPSIAAPLFVAAGATWTLGLNAASFLVSYLAISSIRSYYKSKKVPEPVAIHDQTAPRFRDEFVGGLSLVWRTPLIRTILISAALSTLGIGALNALDVYFVLENLHAGTSWFGMLAALYGVGILVGAASASRFAKRLGSGEVFSWSLIAFGLTFVVYSRTTSLWIALALHVVFGIALGALNTVAFPLILRATPPEYLGRVMAVFNPMNQLAAVLSMGVAAVLVSTVFKDLDASVLGLHFGRIDTVYLAGGLIVLTGGVYARTTMPMKTHDRLAPIGADEIDLNVKGEELDDTGIK